MKTGGEAEIEKYPDSLDLLGNFPDAQEGQIETPVMFEGVSELETELGLQKLRPMRNSEGNLFLKSMMPLNTVMFRGHTIRQKTPNAEWKVTQNGRGHWG